MVCLFPNQMPFKMELTNKFVKLWTSYYDEQHANLESFMGLFLNIKAITSNYSSHTDTYSNFSSHTDTYSNFISHTDTYSNFSSHTDTYSTWINTIHIHSTALQFSGQFASCHHHSHLGVLVGLHPAVCSLIKQEEIVKVQWLDICS